MPECQSAIANTLHLRNSFIASPLSVTKASSRPFKPLFPVATVLGFSTDSRNAVTTSTIFFSTPPKPILKTAVKSSRVTNFRSRRSRSYSTPTRQPRFGTQMPYYEDDHGRTNKDEDPHPDFCESEDDSDDEGKRCLGWAYRIRPSVNGKYSVPRQLFRRSAASRMPKHSGTRFYRLASIRAPCKNVANEPPDSTLWNAGIDEMGPGLGDSIPDHHLLDELDVEAEEAHDEAGQKELEMQHQADRERNGKKTRSTLAKAKPKRETEHHAVRPLGRGVTSTNARTSLKAFKKANKERRTTARQAVISSGLKSKKMVVKPLPPIKPKGRSALPQSWKGKILRLGRHQLIPRVSVNEVDRAKYLDRR